MPRPHRQGRLTGAATDRGPDADTLAALERPDAYPGDASARRGVECIQTHLSHVFLTAERVYKLRKAVELGFVSFGARQERNADCLREVALNRRLAGDVYLGVAPLLGRGAQVRVGPLSETLAQGAEGRLEHFVVMRRLPAGRDALSLLERGRLSPRQIDRVAARIAAFHAAHGLGHPAPFSAEAWFDHVTRPVEDNFGSLREHGFGPEDSEPARRARERARAFAAAHAPRFEARRREGRAVDGHGDLHLQHIWFEDGDAEPTIIDCLEFSDALRRIDAASEVAFTAMDLRYRAAPELAERFLRVYARDADDFDLYRVVDYFCAHRAAVRAKVAAIAAADRQLPAAQRERACESARRHLELAARSLESRPLGPLLLLGGLVGTGKSTAATGLADALGGAVLASDRLRKRLAGLSPTARSAAGVAAGLYAASHTERTYAGLLARALPVLESGRAAILDASFARRSHRELARRWARDLGTAAICVETRCAAERALERLARRERRGADASDAGPGFYATHARNFEPVDEWDEREHYVISTDEEGWRDELPELARRIARSHPGAGRA